MTLIQPLKQGPSQEGGTAGADPVAPWRFGPFVLDPAVRELRRGAEVLKTTHKMFDLLSVLLQNRHRVVPHAQLIEAVWPRVHVSPGVLPQMVRKLRLVLGDVNKPSGAGWIQGTRGVGYRFLGPVERVTGQAGAAGPEPASLRLVDGPGLAVPSRWLGPFGATDSPEQALCERARDQLRRDDLDGLAQSITELRSTDFSGDGHSHRLCLIWADIFESHLGRFRGDSRGAWHHLESAQLMLEGLDEPHLQFELHSVRGLYFETFTSEAEALSEFEKAWTLALKIDDLRLRAAGAARLAFSFSRTSNWTAFEQWTKSSLQLAAQCGSQSIWLRHTVAAAMGWQEMGNFMASAGRTSEARDAWSKSLRLNESVLGEPAGADVSERTRRIARINRLTLMAELRPERWPECVAGLRDCLADETRPSGQIQLQQALAALLLKAGQHADAQALCCSALDACSAQGINECRSELLTLRADIASAQGDLAAANTALRELLRWNREQAAQQAQRLAAITAVRLDTERLLALAEAERARVKELTLENSALRRRAAMLEGAAEHDGLSGLASPSRFKRYLDQAWSEARARHVPLCVAMVAIDTWPAGTSPPDRWSEHQPARDTARLLLDYCRGGDVVAALEEGGFFAVIFDAVGMARAMAVCQRIRKALHKACTTTAVEMSATIAVADAARLAHVADAMDALKQAIAAAQRAGGNQVCTAGPCEVL